MGVPATGRRSISLPSRLRDGACWPLAGSQDPGRVRTYVAPGDTRQHARFRLKQGAFVPR